MVVYHVNNMILITIALTRYNEPDWLLNLTLESIARQREVNAKVHVLDQSFHQETKYYCKGFRSESIVFEYQVIPSKVYLMRAMSPSVSVKQTSFS